MSTSQWTVGQLRAELVGIPDDTPLAVDIPTKDGPVRRLPIAGAGYGPGIDPDEPIFAGQEFPLTVGQRTLPAGGVDLARPRADWPVITDQGIEPDQP